MFCEQADWATEIADFSLVTEFWASAATATDGMESNATRVFLKGMETSG
jgi:hypothetical protein